MDITVNKFMKPVVFIGAERVGKAVLEALLNVQKNIVAVFTAHATLKSRIADFTDFSDLERRYPHTDFYYIENSSETTTIKKIKSYKPEAIFVISWSQIIPIEILKIPPKGMIGLHYSLLPKRRGGAPLNWAIIDGLTESGITLFYLDKKIDTGDIISQRKFSIEHEDTVNDLLEKIKLIAPQFILEYFDKIIKGNAPRRKQDNTKATYTPRRTPKESKMDELWPIEKIHNFIRALVPPYPPAFLKFHNKKVVFTSAKKLDNKRLKVEGYIIEEDV